VSNEREAVLAAVRRAAGRRAAHPGAYTPEALREAAASGSAPAAGAWAAFAAALAGVGGRAHGPFAAGALAAAVSSLARDRAAGGRALIDAQAAEVLGAGMPGARGAPGVPAATQGLVLAPADAAPRVFEDVAVAVLSGQVGVAEDAAVAVLGDAPVPRALAFLCRHLVLLLGEDAIAPDMHTAFTRLPADVRARPRLVWISGPSKTADIEQTLVYGAHGPLTLDVVGVAGAVRHAAGQ
jgi:L-lactate dehydrogenase complex protein LldG